MHGTNRVLFLAPDDKTLFHRQMPSRMHGARSFVLAVMALAACSAAPVAGQSINLAGTFNNWATSDSTWRMEKTGDGSYALDRFFDAGASSFKFVFDGSWNRHLGDAGGGRLAQPGGDIALVIRRSGYYRIGLSLEPPAWTIEPAKPRRPVPVLDVRCLRHDTYELSAARSVLPGGGGAVDFEFTASAAGGEVAQGAGIQVEKLSERTARLTIPAAGVYNINLAVRDDRGAERTGIAVQLGDAFDLVDAATGEFILPLERLSATAWGGVVPSNTSQKLAIRGFSLPRPLPVTIQAEQSNEPLLVRFDVETLDVTTVANGWHAFQFDREAMEGLPQDFVIERVELVGSFNGWRAGAHPLRRETADRFSSVIELPDGVHHYKFLVNGVVHLEDPAADRELRASDGNGGFNSGLIVGDDARTMGPPEPGSIVRAGLKHDPASNWYFSPFGRGLASLRLRTLDKDVTRAALAILSTEGEELARYPLFPESVSAGFQFWSATFRCGGERVRYRLEAFDGPAGVVLGAGGIVSTEDATTTSPAPFEAAIQPDWQTPDWAKTAVWYQIFPERFRNGDKSNDPRTTVPWTHEWFKPYRDPHRRPASRTNEGARWSYEEKGKFHEFIYDRRYGGDIQGVQEKLPYLRELGVTAIYFNPIFQAQSLHKYDASDYRHIDDHFGVHNSLAQVRGETADPHTWQWSESDKVFLAFLKEAHRQGFKVIIDGVFNHVGRDFWAFRDVLKKGKKSPYAGWFDIVSFEPFHYKAWDRDDGSLPRLKHDDALGLARPVRQHIFAVTRRWMDPDGDGDPSDGIDGWRLDVASDINEHFWKDWRKLVKEINPDAYIVAELWQESRAWLDGRTFDAVMNYPFARSAQRFFVNNKRAIKPARFDAELREQLAWYTPQVNYVLQNLFDSHDTDRVASMFMNPDLEYDQANRLQDNGPNYNTARPTSECYRRLLPMVTFQMTFPGAPMIYYGDEVGMYGADDPSDRKPMIWPDLPNDDPEERIEPQLLEHYRRMIAIRQACPALQLGAFHTLMTDDRRRVYAYARVLGDESVVVFINNSDKSHRVNVPVDWPETARIVRLDDPEQAELVAAVADDSASRTAIRVRPGVSSKWHVKDGKLVGGTLAGRTAAIFARHAP